MATAVKVAVICVLVSCGWGWEVPGQTITNAPTTNLPTLSVSDAGPYWRVWEGVSVVTNEAGATSYQTNAFTELRTGLNYAQDGQWVPAVEVLTTNATQVLGQPSQYQLTVVGDLATTSAVSVLMPDGQTVRSTPLALAYYDAGRGQSVVLATVQSCAGQLVGSNQVLFVNAFSNVWADVQLTYTRHGLRQEVIVRQAPPGPEVYGLDPATTRLEWWTEYGGAPTPRLTGRVLQTTVGAVEPELVDEIIAWETMQVGEGWVYGVGSGVGEQMLAKRWLGIGGREVLVGSVEYEAVASLLGGLPAGAGGTNGVVEAGRVLPASLGGSSTNGVGFGVGGGGPSGGLVLGYEVGLYDRDVALRGDRTYWVSGEVNLGGTTVLEGGTVVKYTNGPGARLSVWGPLVSQASAYRPVVLTAQDDDSVGEVIAGSTGQPVGWYAEVGLDLRDSSGGGAEVGHVRVRYARVGVKWGPGGGYGVSHGQMVHCGMGTGLEYSGGYWRNVLVYDVGEAVGGSGGVLRGEQVTVHLAGALNPSSAVTLYLTNSLVVEVSATNNFAGEAVAIPVRPRNVFVQTRAGAHYLQALQYRQAGTTNINPNLAADLSVLTTYPPLELVLPSNSITLAPQALRNTGLPDLGYHYDPIDYICSNTALGDGALTLTNGVVLGVVGTTGFLLQPGARFQSVGSPVFPNRLVRYQAVQELPVALGSNTVNQSVWRVAAGSGPAPEIRARFTDLPMLAGNCAQRQYVDWEPGPGPGLIMAFTDCQLRGGAETIRLLNGPQPVIVGWTNNLAERVSLELDAGDPAANGSLFLRNNLFRFGRISLASSNGAPTCEVYDNLFEGVVLTQGGTGAANGYNGYLNTPELLGGVSNVVLTNFAYAAGPYGRFYQAMTDLRDRGSRTADQAGLYHYTTTADQVKEANTRVDIGLHYVACHTQFQASDDFSRLQGLNQWYYRYSSTPRGLASAFMLSFDPTNGCWEATGDPDCMVGSATQSSSPHHDSVRTFRAPQAGMLSIQGTAVQTQAVAGVSVRVQQNHRVLLDWTPVPVGSTGLAVALTALVQPGDALHFQVSGSSVTGPIQWSPTMTYLEPEQQRRPWDSDGDGLPDYVEDANGNGLADAGETDWQKFDSDFDGVSDGQETADGTDPLDSLSFNPASPGYWTFTNADAALASLPVPSVFRVPIPTLESLSALGAGPYWRVWEGVSVVTNEAGAASYQTHAFTELRTGLNYSQGGQWVPAVEVLTTNATQVLGQPSQYQLTVAGDLATTGAVSVLMPDGQTVRSTPLALAYYDAGRGQSVVWATVRSCAGQLVGSNQVLFVNAFSNVWADVQLTYTRHGVRQEVMIRQAPPGPEVYGLDPATTRLEWWTEYGEAPAPRLTGRVLQTTVGAVEPELVDEIIAWDTMQVGEGWVYGVGSGVGEQMLAKRWLGIGGREALVGAVEYEAVASLLGGLPAGAGGSNGVVEAGRVLPASLGGSSTNGVGFGVGGGGPGGGLVLGYEVGLYDRDVVLRGDRTYWVSGEVILGGATVLEGGAVVKYTNGPGARLSVWGPLVSQASAYRPVVLTAQDDDSVGEVIAGSTGQPAGWYGEVGLDLRDSSGGGAEVGHVRVGYARVGVKWGPGGGYGVSHGQMVHCGVGTGLAYSEGYWRNVLVYDVGEAVGGGGVLRGEQVTVHLAGALNPSSAVTLYLTNSLVVEVSATNNFVGEANVFLGSATAVFQSALAGLHYLPLLSPFRQQGTTNIDAGLARELAGLTTAAPIALRRNLSGQVVLLPEAPRDTGPPDLGYHYDPLDFVCGDLPLTNGSLLLSNGVAVGVFRGCGLRLGSGALIGGQGTPSALNRWVRYGAVQEEPLIVGYRSPNQALWRVTEAFPTPPEVRLRFTDLPMLAASPAQNQYVSTAGGMGGLGTLSFTDCQLRGGSVTVLPSQDPRLMTVALTNNLVERVNLSLQQGGSGSAPLAVYLLNNLFLNSQVGLCNSNGAGPWAVYDNLFDGVRLIAAGDSVSNGFNGYLNTPLLQGGVSNVVLTNFTFVTGPLGNYYQASVQLQDAGSRLASQAGLYHYTTSTNQAQEGNSQVDIGLHYVATQPGQVPLPVDTAGDGTPDYLKDPDGDGTPDGTITYRADSDGDGVSDADEITAGTDPHDPASFPPVRLGHWRFDRPDWVAEGGQAPVEAFNVLNVPSFDGNALLVDQAASPAVLRYRATELDGAANVPVRCGSVRFLYRPNWTSVSFGGQGPGQPVCLWALGSVDHGAEGMALGIDRTGTNILFTSQDSAGERYEIAGPIGFSANNWYEITLTVSAVPVSPVNRVQVWVYANLAIDEESLPYLPLPSDTRRANTFTFGSRADGSQPACGMLDELETFNFELGQTGARMNNNVLSATASLSPPRLDLAWRRGANLPATLQRQTTGDTNWTTLTNLTSWSYSDRQVQPGQTYRYRWLFGNTAFVENSLTAGLALAPLEQRGTIALLVDQTVAPVLSNSLAQLQQDLVGDGWNVLLHQVPRHDDSAWNSAATNLAYIADLSLVKSLLTHDYAAASVPLRAVLIIGHVTIPYSGEQAEDAHVLAPADPGNHDGAWPADAYYGDMDGVWTDQTVNYVNPYNPVLQNLPGDGKFDQNQLPARLALAVGRVDFARLPAFAAGPRAQSETDLLVQYLAKAHRYRLGQVSLPGRSTVQGNIPFENEVFFRQALTSSSSWFGFAPGKLLSGDLFTQTRPCQWGFEFGPGSPTAINAGRADRHSTVDLADPSREPPIAFYALSGSYFPDWNFSDDNLMRATLAMPDFGLIALWARAGTWNLGTLALGGTFGDAFLQTANDPAQTRSARTTYLLGDLTLRQGILAPPATLSGATNGPDSVILEWPGTSDGTAQYWVYRSTRPQLTAASDFVRLTSDPLTFNAFNDASPAPGLNWYEVRALKLTDTGSGSYTNLSQGVFTLVHVAPVPSAPATVQLAAGTSLTFTNTVANAGLTANGLQFSLIAAPDGVALNSTNGVLSWTPPLTQFAATNRITVRVTDNADPPLSVTNMLTVLVTNAVRTLSGMVSYYGDSAALSGIGVTLSGDDTQGVQTDAHGEYRFTVKVPGDYTVSPNPIPEDASNQGVSALDLNLIRRHILALAPLTSPYALIAADVTGRGLVTTLDLAYLRRLILQTLETLPNGLWQFVPAAYSFPNLPADWSHPQTLQWTNLTDNFSGQDFLAIKLGDVSGAWTPANVTQVRTQALATAKPGGHPRPSQPVRPTVAFQIGNLTAAPGGLVSVPVTVAGFTNVTSAQFTLRWDPAVLQFIRAMDFEGVRGVDASVFGTNYISSGKLTIAWDDPAGVGASVADGTIFFAVQFIVSASVGTTAVVGFADSPTPRQVGVNAALALMASQDGSITVRASSSGAVLSAQRPRSPGPPTTFRLTVPTVNGKSYSLEATDLLVPALWQTVAQTVGDDSVQTLVDPQPTAVQRFYRVRIQP